MSGRGMTAALDGRYWVRHAFLTASGTWAPPGVGYCSDVIAGANQDLVYEVPIDYPASFGNPDSYMQSIAIGYTWAKNWLFANPYQTFGLGGYSQGGEVAAMIRMALSPGGELAQFMPNYVGGFTFGNPRRPAGHTGGGAPDPGGAGISTTLMTAADVDANWWDEANGPANGASGIDMYTATPNNGAGTIIRTFYTMATSFGFSDFGAMVTAIAKGIMQLLAQVLGVQVTPGGGILGELEGLLAKFVVLGQLAGAGVGLLKGDGLSLGIGSAAPTLESLGVGVMDAIEAAVIALKFLGSGTAPHVTYESTFATPGVTHIQHAIDHVNSCATAVTARTAA